jgi:hypothetical protein
MGCMNFKNIFNFTIKMGGKKKKKNLQEDAGIVKVLLP